MGEKIDFTAQTAVDMMGSPGAYGPAVPVGTATTSTMGWTWDPCTVDGHLHNYAANPPINAACTGVNPPQTSEDWLKVTFTFTPDSTGYLSPMLSSWRAQYDCVPME